MRRAAKRDLLTFFGILALVGVPVWYGVARWTYRWRWDGVADIVWYTDESGRHAGPLLHGLVMTFEVSLLAIALSLPLGIIVGLGRISPNRGLRLWASAYVELIRNTPLLVQIFIVYYFLGTVFDAFPLGALWRDNRAFMLGGGALAIFAGAYLAEIIRGGIAAVPTGQMEAARALGLSRGQAMRHVILPQGLRNALPAMAGQFISLIKDSSLLGMISVVELVQAARVSIGWSFLSLETWFIVAGLYLAICFPLSMAVQRMETRLARVD